MWWWALIKLLPAGFCPISAGCNSKQNVILEGFIKLTVAGLCGEDLGTEWPLNFDGFCHSPHKNRWLAWTTMVLKTPEPWCSRWRVHVTHRRADDSRVQVWLESFPNPVPIFGPLEIQEGTAGSEICVYILYFWFICSVT